MGIVDKSELISIQEFATLCRTTPRTLRFYEEKGLFVPTVIDEFTKYRYYHPNLARDFFKLKLLQEAHMPIAEIQAMQTEELSSAFLDKKLEDMQNDIEEKQKQLHFFKQMKEILYGRSDRASLVQQEEIGPFVLLAFTNDHGRYDSLGEDSAKLTALAKEYKLPVTGKEMTFYLEPFVYKPKDTKMEIAIVLAVTSIPKDVILPEGYYFKYFPKTSIQTFTYQGPFGYSALVYQKLHEKNKNRKLHDHEMYFDYVMHGPWDTTSEYEYVMKLCFPHV